MQMAYLQSIFAPYQIFLNYDGNFKILAGGSFTYHKLDTEDPRSQLMLDQEAYRRKTRVPGAEVLTVWIVNRISFVNDPGANLLAVSLRSPS